MWAPIAARTLLCSTERLQAGFDLADALQAKIASEYGHVFKERRSVFALILSASMWKGLNPLNGDEDICR
jgi:hypothetical protein